MYIHTGGNVAANSKISMNISLKANLSSLTYTLINMKFPLIIGKSSLFSSKKYKAKKVSKEINPRLGGAVTGGHLCNLGTFYNPG